MILGTTGHRNIGNSSLPERIKIANHVEAEAKKYLITYKPEKIITGMAIGWDQLIAELAIKLSIPFIAAVPFKGQESIWRQAAQDKYNKLLDKAAEVVVVSPGSFSNWKMQLRNQYIVDHSDQMLACFDGSRGGTSNCIDYAKSKNKKVDIINPSNV